MWEPKIIICCLLPLLNIFWRKKLISFWISKKDFFLFSFCLRPFLLFQYCLWTVPKNKKKFFFKNSFSLSFLLDWDWEVVSLISFGSFIFWPSSLTERSSKKINLFLPLIVKFWNFKMEFSFFLLSFGFEKERQRKNFPFYFSSQIWLSFWVFLWSFFTLWRKNIISLICQIWKKEVYFLLPFLQSFDFSFWVLDLFLWFLSPISLS